MIAWMIESMIVASLMMLVVLAVRRPVAELFGAGWAYALWLLPVLIPLLPPVPLLPSAADAPALIVVPAMSVAAAAGTAQAPVPAGGDSSSLLLMLLSVWAGGAIAFAVWQQSSYSAFMLHLGPSGRPAAPPEFGGIKVVESDAVDGPVAVGLFRRRIVVPEDFLTRYTPSEQRLALEHELVHHRRFDLLWNWVGLALLTVNWFNPIVHLAFRAFRQDQELSCDAAVTRRRPSERHDYAVALVKSASQPGLVAVCPLNHADMLKRRLRMMKKHRVSWSRTAGGVAAVAAVAGAGLLIAAPGFAREEQRSHTQIVMNGAEHDPVIPKEDLDTLRRKCGGNGKDGRQSIVCTDAQAHDPEVRAIMERTRKRVEAQVAKARLSDRDLKEIRRSVDEAQASAREIEVRLRPEIDRARDEAEKARHRIVIMGGPDGRMPDVEAALERARMEIAQLDIPRIQREAMESAMASARERINARRLTRDSLDAARDALDAARDALDDIDVGDDEDEGEALAPPAPPAPPLPPAPLAPPHGR